MFPQIEAVMRHVFDQHWESLPEAHQAILKMDLFDLARSEFRGNIAAAAAELPSRIGGRPVLRSYAETLLAGEPIINVRLAIRA